jgi:hypothetical protein
LRHYNALALDCTIEQTDKHSDFIWRSPVYHIPYTIQYDIPTANHNWGATCLGEDTHNIAQWCATRMQITMHHAHINMVFKCVLLDLAFNLNIQSWRHTHTRRYWERERAKKKTHSK